MARAKVKPSVGGGETARRKGLVSKLVYLTREQRNRIAAAAALSGQPAATFIVAAAEGAAEKILEKSAKQA